MATTLIATKSNMDWTGVFPIVASYVFYEILGQNRRQHPLAKTKTHKEEIFRENLMYAGGAILTALIQTSGQPVVDLVANALDGNLLQMKLEEIQFIAAQASRAICCGLATAEVVVNTKKKFVNKPAHVK